MLVLSKEVTPELNKFKWPPFPFPSFFAWNYFCWLKSSLHSKGHSLPAPTIPFLPPSFLSSSLSLLEDWNEYRRVRKRQLWLEEEIGANEQLRWIQYPAPNTLYTHSHPRLVTSHLDYCHSFPAQNHLGSHLLQVKSQLHSMPVWTLHNLASTCLAKLTSGCFSTWSQLIPQSPCPTSLHPVFLSQLTQIAPWCEHIPNAL